MNASSTTRATMGRHEKLKSRKLLERLFREGKKLHTPHLRVYVTVGNLGFAEGRFPLQAGVGASSRNFRRATDRNRVKRVLRECIRKHKAPLVQVLQQQGLQMAVFFLFTDRVLPVYSDVEAQVRQLMDRLMRLCTSKSNP